MLNAPVQERTATPPTLQSVRAVRKHRMDWLLRSYISQHIVLLACTALLFFGSILISPSQPDVYAANPGVSNSCNWYRVQGNRI